VVTLVLVREVRSDTMARMRDLASATDGISPKRLIEIRGSSAPSSFSYAGSSETGAADWPASRGI
jgi:hypothetical protein